MAVSEKNSRGSIEQVKAEKRIPKTEQQQVAPDSPEVFLHNLEWEIGALREETVTELNRIKTDSGLSPKEITEAAQEIGLTKSLREIDREATDLIRIATADSEEREVEPFGKNETLAEELSFVESQIATIIQEGRGEAGAYDELKYLKLKREVISLEMLRERARPFEQNPTEPDESERERQRITEAPEAARIALREIERLSEAIEEKGYDYASFRNLDASEVPEEREFFEQISKEFYSFNDNHADAVSSLGDLDGEVILTLADESKSQINKAILIGEFISFNHEKKVPVRHFLETVKQGGINIDDFENRIKEEIIRQKEIELQKLPASDLIDELLSGSECMPTGYRLERSVKKMGEEIRYRIENGDVNQARDMVEKLRTLNGKSMESNGQPLEIRTIQAVFPEIPTGKWDELLDIMEGEMSQEFYDRYRETYDEHNENDFFRRLAPERCIKVGEVDLFLKRQYRNGRHLTYRELEDFLSDKGLIFSELDDRRKSWAFRSFEPDEVGKAPFSLDDVRQLLVIHWELVDLSIIPIAFRSGLKKEMVEVAKQKGYGNLTSDEVQSVRPFLDDEELKNALIAGADLDVSEILTESDIDLKKAIITNISKRWRDFEIDKRSEILLSLDSADFRLLLKKDIGIRYSDIPEGMRTALKPEIVAYICRVGLRYYSSADSEQFIRTLDVADLRILLDAGAFNDLSIIPEHVRGELKKEIVADAIRRKLPHYSDSRIMALSYFTRSDFEKLFEADILIYPSEVPESLRDEFQDSFVKMGASRVRNGHIDDALISNPDYRVGILDTLVQDFDESVEQGSTSDIRQTRMKHIRDSFCAIDSPELLPEAIGEIAMSFEERYGKRGKHLIALALTAYGADDSERFVERMRSVEKVLDRYYEEDIPDGVHVSAGFEYEVTDSVGREYDTGSVLGYVNDINLASRSGFIGKGYGGMHEIATKPTYNPYLLLAERKLLQDAGFIDFNFERYPKASRGYHLNIGGESGLAVDQNAYFLSNVMTMAQLNGAIAGNDVTSVKGIYKKGLDDVFDGKHQGGVRVEMKGGGCDTVEQFERAILTSHYAGVAIQLCDRYIANDPTDDALLKMSDDPETFEHVLETSGGLLTPFRNIRERDMVHFWMLLKRDMVLAVDQHNESFFESEFDGSFVNPKGEYIETADQIDVIRNQRLVSEEDRSSESFKERFHIEPMSLFGPSTPAFENAIARTNNIFLGSSRKSVQVY